MRAYSACDHHHVLAKKRHFFHAIGREKERKRKGKRRKGKEKRREKKRGRKEGNPIYFSIPPIDLIRKMEQRLPVAATWAQVFRSASCMSNDGNLAQSEERTWWNARKWVGL
jgi:hypothetical protein